MVTEFVINNREKIVCRTHNNKKGFRHIAEYVIDGRVVERRSTQYYNRTWEHYQYETVITMLLDKMKLSPKKKAHILAITSGKARADLDARFGSVAMIASLGEVFGKTKKEKNDWKMRMIKAGMPGIQQPPDWNELSEDEKERRLNKIIKELRK